MEGFIPFDFVFALLCLQQTNPDPTLRVQQVQLGFMPPGGEPGVGIDNRERCNGFERLSYIGTHVLTYLQECHSQIRFIVTSRLGCERGKENSNGYQKRRSLARLDKIGLSYHPPSSDETSSLVCQIVTSAPFKLKHKILGFVPSV